MADIVRCALLLTVCGLSACASPRAAPGTTGENEAASAKTAEALQACIVERLGEGRPAGLPAPNAGPSRTLNGYAIDFPPLAHVGILVLRNEDGTSVATWQATEPQHLGPIGAAVRGCAAG